MLTVDEARELIDRVFEEEALALGGMVAVHELEDDLVWRLIRNMGVIRGRVLRELQDRPAMAADRGLTPHPAIEGFLTSLGRP